MIQDQLFTQLNGLTGGRMYPQYAPQNSVYPFLVYQLIAGIQENVLQGATNLRNSRFQVDCWAKTYGAVKTLAAQVTAAMDVWSVKNVQVLEQDFYETDVQVHRVSIDFSIWHN